MAVYIYDFDKDKCRDLISSIVLRHAADGIILFANIELYEKPDIPVLCFSHTGKSTGDSVGYDTKKLLSDAIDYLAELGHTKIGFIGEHNTAIIAAYDEIAISLIHVLAKNGVSVPDDISVMGIHNIPATIYAPLPLTTIETFSEEGYRAAVRILLDRIHNESRGAKHIEIRHQIIPRETTKVNK